MHKFAYGFGYRWLNPARLVSQFAQIAFLDGFTTPEVGFRCTWGRGRCAALNDGERPWRILNFRVPCNVRTLLTGSLASAILSAAHGRRNRMTDRSPTQENPLRQNLPLVGAPDPCAVVLFGATGDLTHRKLAPALFHLAEQGHLPSDYAVVGFARRDWSDDRFRSELKTTLSKGNLPDFESAWERFAPHVAFASGNFDEPAAYEGLRRKLEQLDVSHGTMGNRLFYLAVSPEYFSEIVSRLGHAGLIHPAGRERPWSRVVIEKPFGSDLASARKLSQDISSVVEENQIYRIDHYLGKETVQNILALRFGNAIFEPLWDRRHVASVQITAAEEVGMAGGRGGYYDKSGAHLETWSRTT